jgi:hypothetical protein
LKSARFAHAQVTEVMHPKSSNSLRHQQPLQCAQHAQHRSIGVMPPRYRAPQLGPCCNNVPTLGPPASHIHYSDSLSPAVPLGRPTPCGMPVSGSQLQSDEAQPIPLPHTHAVHVHTSSMLQAAACSSRCSKLPASNPAEPLSCSCCSSDKLRACQDAPLLSRSRAAAAVRLPSQPAHHPHP